MTYSVGFRMPSCSEILADLSAELNAQSCPPIHVRDPQLRSLSVKDDIPSNYLVEIRAALSEILNDDKLLLEWFAKYMTEPKYPDFTDLTNEERVASIKSNHSKKGVVEMGKSSKKFKNGRLV